MLSVFLLPHLPHHRLYFAERRTWARDGANPSVGRHAGDLRHFRGWHCFFTASRDFAGARAALETALSQTRLRHLH